MSQVAPNENTSYIVELDLGQENTGLLPGQRKFAVRARDGRREVAKIRREYTGLIYEGEGDSERVRSNVNPHAFKKGDRVEVRVGSVVHNED